MGVRAWHTDQKGGRSDHTHHPSGGACGGADQKSQAPCEGCNLEPTQHVQCPGELAQTSFALCSLGQRASRWDTHQKAPGMLLKYRC